MFWKSNFEHCAPRNLKCTFIDSGKKCELETGGEYLVQVNVSNGSEIDFDRISILPFIILNPVRGHVSTLSLFGYPQQQPDNIDDVTLHSKFYAQNRSSHSSTISLSEYPQQHSDNTNDVLFILTSMKKLLMLFKKFDHFFYQ
ncbi:33148_t:CDS:2, partial [Gigaspora margarita]